MSDQEINENWEPTDEDIRDIQIEHMDFISNEEINETLRTSMLRVSRQEKLDRLGGSMAARLAKGHNDPDYRKMIKYKNLWKQFKQKVMMKYGMRGKQAARQSAMRSE
jgi:hypothetical protein